MDTEVKKDIRVTIVMNQKEAEWLHAMVQNPLWEDESDEDSEMREKFWDATNVAV